MKKPRVNRSRFSCFNETKAGQLWDELDVSCGTPCYALTSKRGWEWFNSVKEEGRYKALCEKAIELTK